MPEYTRPNLEIPVGLWGEVKVSAFRRGVRPNTVVVDLLREKFGERGVAEGPMVKRTVVSEPKSHPESVPQKGVLREGYGWCKACEVGQVKLPGLLCPACK